MTYQVIGSSKTRALRVLWMLEELGLPYTHIPAGPRSAEAVAANPSGKVPVLVVDGVTLTDSAAILTFLADRHGQFTHAPGSLDRARQDGLTCLIVDELEGPLWMAARHSFVLPEAMRLPAIKDSLKWEFAQSQARLAARLTGPFVMGDVMTVPDLLLTHCLHWAQGAKFPDLEPVLADYLTRMRGRPAWTRAMAR
jgi:glutathione S-transferase